MFENLLDPYLIPDNVSAVASAVSDCRTSTEYSNNNGSPFNYPSKYRTLSSFVNEPENIVLPVLGDRDIRSNCAPVSQNFPSHPTIAPKFPKKVSNSQVYSECLPAAGQPSTLPYNSSSAHTVALNPPIVTVQCLQPHNAGTPQSSVPSNSGEVTASSNVLMDYTSIPVAKQSSSTHSLQSGGWSYQESRGSSEESQAARPSATLSSAPSEEPEVEYLLGCIFMCCGRLKYVDMFHL